MNHVQDSRQLFQHSMLESILHQLGARLDARCPMIVYLLKGYRALGHMEEVGDFATSASGSATRSYRVADRAQFDQRLSTILSLFPVHSIDRSNKNPSGTRQGLAISDHIKDVGGIRTQFHHVIDIGADDP